MSNPHAETPPLELMFAPKQCGHECFQCAKEELARATEKITRLAEVLAGGHEPEAPLLSLAGERPHEPEAPLLSLAGERPHEPEAPLLTIEDAANLTGLTRSAINQAISRKAIPVAKRVPGTGKLAGRTSPRLARADVEAYAERRK